ncbi:hypothetical protein PSCICN_20330 [Pseudomonas cichorii]|uniref:hypothetical protein n=1 Tax=Pseudomonas cichorii TaxID=36746 RepID=UPI001910423F|nr:hypothetical protein [Pseudomonas cichorii]GFM81341.1 hypothetical protein PSCICN_20330 [Pseudomonas cichorii]
MLKMAVAALIVVSVSGCVGLNPEREMIKQLVGKDVNEAKGFLFSTMGDPVYEPTPVPSIIADSIPASVERLYQWETLVYYEDVPVQTGSYQDVNMGRPMIVYTYDYKRVNHYCTVNLKVDTRNIIKEAKAGGSGCTRLSKSWYFGM